MLAELDLADLRLRAAAAVGEEIDEFEPLLGGRSAITYQGVVAAGGERRRIVVKVAPPGLEPVRHRDVLRQARILKALGPVPGVRVPELLGTDAGEPPEVPPLFAMSFVPGESLEPLHELPARPEPDRDTHARAYEAARALAALGEYEPMPDVVAGEAPLSPADELERWRRAFETVGPELADGAAQCHRLLAAEIPTPLPPRVVHGDWRLGNMQCRAGEVLAVIDWEIWALADPRVDLAWFLSMTDPRHLRAVADPAVLPPPEELRAAYEDAAGRRVERMEWFGALAFYKQAAAGALIVKNSRKRGIDDEDLALTAALVPSLLDLARTALT